MPRLREVPRSEAAPSVVAMYDFLYDDRDESDVEIGGGPLEVSDAECE